MSDLVILPTGKNDYLARLVANHLEVELWGSEPESFSDMEFYNRIQKTVRGKDVFLIQTYYAPPNERLAEWMVTLDAVRRASASRITAVIPYFFYGRQDRKTKPREPITARQFADSLEQWGIDRVLTMDLHVGQIQGFFKKPVDELTAIPYFKDYLEKNNYLNNLVVVSPDTGGVNRAVTLASLINKPLAVIYKYKTEHERPEALGITGEDNVKKSKIAAIIDDILGTGNTLLKAADKLRELGIEQVVALITHSLLVGDATEKLKKNNIKVITTNTCYQIEQYLKENSSWIYQIGVEDALGEAIKRIHLEESVSGMSIDGISMFTKK